MLLCSACFQQPNLTAFACYRTELLRRRKRDRGRILTTLQSTNVHNVCLYSLLVLRTPKHIGTPNMLLFAALCEGSAPSSLRYCAIQRKVSKCWISTNDSLFHFHFFPCSSHSPFSEHDHYWHTCPLSMLCLQMCRCIIYELVYAKLVLIYFPQRAPFLAAKRV